MSTTREEADPGQGRRIVLTGTVQGGASQAIKKIQPGGCVAMWDPVTSATAGYTALSVQSDTSGATFEMFLGG